MKNALWHVVLIGVMFFSGFCLRDWQESQQTSVATAAEQVIPTPPKSDEQWKLDNACVERQIIDLPQDGQAWHTSLFLHDDWESIDNERRMVAWFETEPRLSSLKAQTIWHLYTESDPIYQERFRESIPVLPAVVLQKDNGEVVYKASVHAIPDSSDKLARDIRATINRRCPGPWCRPSPEPGPVPRPKPDVKPQPQPANKPAVPDIAKPDRPPNGGLLILTLIAGACSAAFGAYVQFKKQG